MNYDKPTVNAKEVARIVREECAPAMRDDDMAYMGQELADFLDDERRYSGFEYRFQGELGFGGKLRCNGVRVYVDCYQEDETPARKAKIERVNNRIADLVASGEEASLPDATNESTQ